MNKNIQEIFEKIEELTGYRFSDMKLLEEAFTHSTFLNETEDNKLSDNERLEFFGDSVLSLFISHRLLKEFPESREGELSRMRAALVHEAALARTASELGIGGLLRLGLGEERSGGRTKSTILADAFEALIGALYLDGGADAVIPFIDRHYTLLSSEGWIALSGRDSKSEFQEAAHFATGVTPRYETIGTAGPDHAKIFTVALFIGDELMGEGSGRSKKAAEQEAARQGLDLLLSRSSSGIP